MPHADPDPGTPDKAAAAAPNARYLHGAAWSGLNAAAAVLLPLGIFVVFARWLPASDIGVVALAVAASEVIKTLGLPGLYEALLQQKEDRQKHAETALAALLISGGVLFCVYLLLTPLLLRLVPGIDGAGWAIAAIGLRIPIDLAVLQPQAALAERLSFRRLALRSVLASLGAGAIGLGLAFAGLPFAGLVAYQIGLSVLLLATTIIGTGALARPRLRRDCLRRLRPEATRASAVRLVAAVNNYLDQIVVAGLLGSLQLAYYNLAKRIETIFITAAASFSSILFQPLFAQRGGSGAAAGLRRGLIVLTITCGLAAATIMATHPRLIGLVFGPSWAPAAPVAAFLALGGYLRALGSAHGSLLSVSGRNRQLLWVSLGSAVSGLVLVGLLAPVSLVLCAAALAGRSLCTTGAMAWLTRRDLPGLGLAYLLEVVLPFGLMLAAAWGAERALARLLAADETVVSSLLILAGAGAAAAGIMLLYFGLRLLLQRQFQGRQTTVREA